jgi:hypothetical protein
MDALIKSIRPNKPSDGKTAELDPSEFMGAAVRADQLRPSRAEAEQAVAILSVISGRIPVAKDCSIRHAVSSRPMTNFIRGTIRLRPRS